MSLFKKISSKVVEDIKTQQSISKKLKAKELDDEKKKVARKYSGAGLTDKELEILAKKKLKTDKQNKTFGNSTPTKKTTTPKKKGSSNRKRKTSNEKSFDPFNVDDPLKFKF